MHTDNLTDKEVPGIVIPEKEEDETDHPHNMGRYKIYIPNHMIHKGLESVIWAKNHIHKFRYGINEYMPGEQLIYGQYFPLQIGSRIIVKFFSNDIQSAYIDRVISDYEDDTLPFDYQHEDQSDITVIARTAKFHNVIAMLEEVITDPLLENTFHIYYHDDQVRIIMDPDGHHTWVEKEQNLWVNKDQHEQILMNQYKQIHMNQESLIKKDKKTEVGVNEKHKVGRTQHNHIGLQQKTLVGLMKQTFVGFKRSFLTGAIDEHRAGMYYAIDAPMIFLNCGVARPMPVMPVMPLEEYDLKPPRDPKSIKPEHLHQEYPKYEFELPEIDIEGNF